MRFNPFLRKPRILAGVVAGRNGSLMSATARSTAAKRFEASKALAESYVDMSDSEVIEAVLAEHKPSANPIVRSIWISFGSIFVVFAGIGIFLPGWPTTSWLVFAAYCLSLIHI